MSNQRGNKTHHIHMVPPNTEPERSMQRKMMTPSPLDKEQTKYIQRVVGTLLYHERAVDNTIFLALSANATEQSKPMERTKEQIQQLLDYCATQEEAIISYTESKMILAIHSDAGYCYKKKS